MSKRNKIIYWIATIWLALGMLSTALVQLFKGKEGAGGVDWITHLGYPVYFLTLLGAWKILGVIAILFPKFPLLKEWAYAGFFFVMSGAAFSHIAAGSANEIFPSLLLLALTVISWYSGLPTGKSQLLLTVNKKITEMMSKAQIQKKNLSPAQREELLSTLQVRFEKNRNRPKGLEWAEVQARLEAHPDKLYSLYEMEISAGEPDLVVHDKKTGEYVFYDCSAESPAGRRSFCYDAEALDARKAHKPKDSALDKAAAMGLEILSEEQYRELQKLGKFDTKTSSWIATPPEIRKLGGALFCDRRYDTVFVYHNGAESYYAARGFRASLRV